MWDIGFSELMVIAIVAVVALGPDRLPELAQQAAKMVRQLRRLANNARDELRSELGPEYADLELRDLDPRAIVRRHIAEALDDEDDEDERPLRRRRGHRPLTEGERPPYDSDAT